HPWRCSMRDDPAYLNCLQAFADRDYAACFDKARLLIAKPAPPVLWQVLLISLQRLGRTDLIEQVGPGLVEAAGDPWQQTLLRVALGQVDPAVAVAQAGDEGQRCQALYYKGARLLTRGDSDAAREALAACVATNVQCEEWLLARYELDSPAPGPAGAAHD